jgi:hypothetical protein
VRPRLRAAVRLAGALVAWGCAAAPPFEESPLDYEPDRRDYFAFRPAWPDLLEPNYLPFMLHRFASPDLEGDLLVLCRWADADLPLAVYVAAPVIPQALQEEWNPRDPAAYEAAVLAALRRWERELEGLVAFRRVSSEAEAKLVLRLVPGRAPAEASGERQPLGATRLRGACRPRGFDPEAERLRVDFSVPEVRLYVADEVGLLTADQVEWVALHEIGHALGMRGHSPLPGDLMYEVARDRVRLPELSIQDVNSFVTLYQLPSGTIFGRVAPASRGPREPEPPPLEPELELAPWVDARRGFELRPPHGWMRFETARGMAAVDGVSWDSSASLQVIVEPHASLEGYLERYGAAWLSHGEVLQHGWIAVDGRDALHATLEDAGRGRVEDLVLVESGDGRLVVVIGDCPAEHADAWRRWFWAALATLRIQSFTSREAPPPPP